MGRTPSVEPAVADRVRVSRPLPPTPPPELSSPGSRPVFDSPFGSPVTSPVGEATVPPIPPAAPAPVSSPTSLFSPFRKSTSGPSASSPLTPTKTSSRLHPLLNRSGSHSSPPAKPRITFDPASSPSADRAPGGGRFRKRANSEGYPSGAKPSLMRSSPSFPPRSSIPDVIPSPSQTGVTGRSNSISTTDGPSSQDPRDPGQGTGHTHAAGGAGGYWRHRTKTIDVAASSADPDETHLDSRDKDEQHNAFVRFIKDLPNWLHTRSSVVGPVTPGGEDGMLEGEAVKRHLRGEVRCLHYGTIDDAGMRQLEGRS